MGIVIRVTRRRVFVALVAAVILFVGIGSFTVVYTATPKACATCHVMVPYYDSWAASEHHEVACVDCHYPPGVEGAVDRQFAGLSQVLSYMNSLGAQGGRLQAQVPDQGCLASGCHEREALRKPLLFGDYILNFRHDLHVGPGTAGIELKCASCHMRTADGEHFSVNPETCWVCHFHSGEQVAADDSKRCLECHGLPLRLNRNMPEDHTRTLAEGIDCQVCHGAMVKGDAAVSATACRRCHVEARPESLLADPEKLHDVHTRNVKVDCAECHGVPEHVSRTRLRAEVPSCESCHPQFHGAQAMLWAGTGFSGVGERPNPMFRSGLTCEACHTALTDAHGRGEIGETRVTTEASCRVCHPDEAEGDYAKLLGPWKSVGTEVVARLRELYRADEGRLGELPDEGPESPGGLYRQGRHHLDLLEAGGVVHNPWYARDVAARILADLNAARRAVDASSPILEVVDRSAAVPAECSTCHFGVAEDLSVFGAEFSHARHTLTGDVSCFECHSHAVDGEHGKTLVKTEADCSACHHGPSSRGADGELDTTRCAACHSLQSAIYEGRWERGATAKPNVMAKDVHCVMCHFPGGATAPVKPAEKDCRACHQEGNLASLLPTFRENLARQTTRVEGLLAVAEKRPGLNEEDLAFFRHVRRTLASLHEDGSGGIHNPALVDEVLTGFAARLEEVNRR